MTITSMIEVSDSYVKEKGLKVTFWYLLNTTLLHRKDGPAVEYNGAEEWYWYGEKIPVSSQEEFERYLRLKAFW